MAASLFASYSAGGAIIARFTLQWPLPPPTNPEETQGPPSMGASSVPDGRYYVLVVRGLVDSPSASVPASAWSEAVVNVTTCGSAPNPPVGLLGGGPYQGGNPRVSLTWSDSPTGCPPEQWEIVAGYAPGAANAASIRLGARVFPNAGAAGNVLRAGPRAQSVRPKQPIERSRDCGEQCAVPGVPPNLTATVEDNQVTLTWDVPFAGSRPIAFYHIAAGSLPAVSNIANIRVPPNTTSFTTAAPPGRYFVRVQAGNGCGGTFEVGLPSNEVIVDVP